MFVFFVVSCRCLSRSTCSGFRLGCVAVCVRVGVDPGVSVLVIVCVGVCVRVAV